MHKPLQVEDLHTTPPICSVNGLTMVGPAAATGTGIAVVALESVELTTVARSVCAGVVTVGVTIVAGW